MSRQPSLRRQWFVDRRIQGALVARVILYWVVCLTAITLMLLCWRIITGPTRVFYAHLEEMWLFYGPAAIASLLLLPLVIVDVVRLSNRFTGPMVRLRRSIRDLARGQHVEPIALRDNDFWREFAEEFNALATRVRGETSPPPDHDRQQEPAVAGVE